MEISDALLAGLSALSAESTDPAFDLPGLVQALQDDLLVAVPSGLGLSITIQVGLPTVTVTTLAGTATVESSLQVPLPSPLAESGSAVVFYAGIPGALVDLAADLQWVRCSRRAAHRMRPLRTCEPAPTGSAPRCSPSPAISSAHWMTGPPQPPTSPPNGTLISLRSSSVSRGTAPPGQGTTSARCTGAQRNASN